MYAFIGDGVNDVCPTTDKFRKFIVDISFFSSLRRIASCQPVGLLIFDAKVSACYHKADLCISQLERQRKRKSNELKLFSFFPSLSQFNIIIMPVLWSGFHFTFCRFSAEESSKLRKFSEAENRKTRGTTVMLCKPIPILFPYIKHPIASSY